MALLYTIGQKKALCFFLLGKNKYKGKKKILNKKSKNNLIDCFTYL